MADWFAEHAPQTDWFAQHAPDTGPGVPNPLQANPQKYTPPALLSGQQQPVPTVGGEALRNLPRSVANYTSLGMTQPDTLPPGGIVNPITGTIDAAKKFGHMVMHPMESFAQDPIATANLPAVPAELARRGAPVAGAAARGAWQEGMSPANIPLTRIPFAKLTGAQIPKAVAYRSEGAALGHHFFGAPGSVVGGAVGAGIPLTKGAIQGVREYLEPPPEFETHSAGFTKPPEPQPPPGGGTPAANPNAPPEGVPQAWWDRLGPDQRQQLRTKLAVGDTQPIAPPGTTAPKTPAPTLPPPKPVHEAAHAIDTAFSPRKATNIIRHLQSSETPIPYDELKTMVDSAKSTGDWSRINQIEQEAWKSGKALESAGKAKAGELVPKTPYRPKSADYSAVPGIEGTEGTWDRILQGYPRSLPAPNPPQ